MQKSWSQFCGFAVSVEWQLVEKHQRQTETKFYKEKNDLHHNDMSSFPKKSAEPLTHVE